MQISHNHELFRLSLIQRKRMTSEESVEIYGDIQITWTILKALLEYYTDTFSHVKIDIELSDPIEVTKGLCQGFSLSPTYI